MQKLKFKWVCLSNEWKKTDSKLIWKKTDSKLILTI